MTNPTGVSMNTISKDPVQNLMAEIADAVLQLAASDDMKIPPSEGHLTYSHCQKISLEKDVNDPSCVTLRIKY